MRKFALLAVLCSAVSYIRAAEEKIRGILEKTAKPNASAQITDALNDVYYISKTDEADKAVANFVGKNVKVVITGTVESKDGDPANYFALKSVEPYAPKMPPAPPAQPTPSAPLAAPEKKDGASDQKEAPKTEVKPAEPKADVKPVEPKK